jgi:hypothetical protein
MTKTKYVIFFVHGMGDHPKNDWAEPWTTQFKKLVRQYEGCKSIPSAKIDLVPLNYDEVFQKHFRKTFANVQQLLDSNVDLGGASGPLGTLASDDQADGEDSFGWTHLLDVALWWTHPHARRFVVSTMAEQITGTLTKAFEDVGKYGRVHASIIAHSLGTSVIHDTIVYLAENEHLFRSDKFRWRALCQFVNTSNRLQGNSTVELDVNDKELDPYRSSARPSANKPIVRTLVNVRHELDPIARLCPFNPSWPTGSYSSFEPNRYEDVKNVHDYETCMASPDVHLRVLRSVFGKLSIGTPEEEAKAQKKYEREFPNTGLSDLIQYPTDSGQSFSLLLQNLRTALSDLN